MDPTTSARTGWTLSWGEPSGPLRQLPTDLRRSSSATDRRRVNKSGRRGSPPREILTVPAPPGRTVCAPGPMPCSFKRRPPATKNGHHDPPGETSSKSVRISEAGVALEGKSHPPPAAARVRQRRCASTWARTSPRPPSRGRSRICPCPAGRSLPAASTPADNEATLDRPRPGRSRRWPVSGRRSGVPDSSRHSDSVGPYGV